MLCFRDQSFCLQSNETYCKENKIIPCVNKKCFRHSAEIPADRGEDSYLPICWSTFPNCGDKICDEVI